LLCIHDGSQGWFKTSNGVEVVVSAYDPWDERYWNCNAGLTLTLVPHGRWTHHDRVRAAAVARAEVVWSQVSAGGGAYPLAFGPLHCEPRNVLVTAFHREHRKAFEHVENAFGPEVRNPYVVRLVEYDGEPADVVLTVAGPCALAARTDLLGRVEESLPVTAGAPPAWSPPDLAWSCVRLRMRPREIATVMLDLELGRHRSRDLDDHRHVWATVHRR
jgi:alpha-mannosidase